MGGIQNTAVEGATASNSFIGGKSATQLAAAISGLARLNIRHLGFYNYGMLRSAQLEALAATLAAQAPA